MYRKILAVMPAVLAVCCACSTVPGPYRALPLPENEQTAEQLHLTEQAAQQPFAGAWVPYFVCEELFADPDEAVCRDAVRQVLQSLKNCGIRSVFVHVCAFGEAGYPSAYYPQNPALGGHDMMQIFTDICKETGMELHAWINPLRLQTESKMRAQTGDALLCQQFHDDAGSAFAYWDGRYYLNPVAESTGSFLTGVITELIERYHPAGIHIDDYFYPTESPAFDAAAFAASGETDLAEWRRSKITALVRQMYRAVHSADDKAVFSVSPQGDLQKNRDSLYADIPLWMRDGACADLIIPQLYFGYRNETMPFAEMLAEWRSLPRAEHVRLAAGLAAYKTGKPDENAGSGAQEWVTEPDTIVRQTEDVCGDSSFDGVVFYHVDALPEAVRDALCKVLQQANSHDII